MAEVKLKNVTKVFEGEVTAVSDFNLTIADAEFLVLVGPSGCGKSTTLNMVAGLEDITSGTIEISSRIVNDVPSKDRDIAMVFQNYALYPHMTVYNNLAFGLKLRKIPKNQISQRVRDASEILGITDLLDRLPKALSGGQRQRVAVGRAIVRNPSVFLFDEPLSNLDAKLRVQMRVEINELHKRLKTTMIYVTHDQTEAMTMGDRIVVMKDGLIHQVDDPITIYDRPVNKFVASFIGTPPINMFDGVISKGDNGLIFVQNDGITLPIPAVFASKLALYENKKVTLGIRPEDIGSVTGELRSELPRIRGKVKVVEPMGSESYIYVDGGSSIFVSRIDSHRKIHSGDNVELSVVDNKVHFFDGETDLTIV